MLSHLQNTWGPGKSLGTIRAIAYWTFTFLVAFEMVAGGIWDLLRIEYVRVMLAHLGYPMYLLTIIGVWKIPCAIVMLLPGFLRLKEWAYAGAVFNYTGAAASHFLAGYSGLGSPLIFTAITLASWALRPPTRRLEAAPPAEQRLASRLVPTLVLIALFILSWIFLPGRSRIDG
ncbi:MAG TPA: DoxX family protein [bacterium]|nr:DoxX family protein [bacterium]